jgi:hypothetical protein
MTSRIEAHPKHHPPSLSDLRASAAKVRLRAGGFLTDNPEHAWSGTPDQARACRLKFNAAAGCKMVEA